MTPLNNESVGTLGDEMQSTIAQNVETGEPLVVSKHFRPIHRAVPSCSGAAQKRLRSLRAVILLDGAVRRSTFADAIDRSILELPLSPGLLVLDLWRQQIGDLQASVDSPDRLTCRIVLGRKTRGPVLRVQDQQAGFTIETDPTELRGTGGVLCDLAKQYDDDDLLLVGNASQVLLLPLDELLEEAFEPKADVTVLANADGTPSSLSLVRCGALRVLPTIGFVDFKEQALQLMASHHDVRVVTRSKAGALSIRTAQDYLSAVRAYHRSLSGITDDGGAFAEHWRRDFSLVEEGADVSPDADIHNSVILRNSVVGAKSLVAESVVCARGVVGRHERVLQQLVIGAGRRSIA